MCCILNEYVHLMVDLLNLAGISVIRLFDESVDVKSDLFMLKTVDLENVGNDYLPPTI